MSAGRANLIVPILAAVAVAAMLGWFGYSRYSPTPEHVQPGGIAHGSDGATGSSPSRGPERTARAMPEAPLPLPTGPAAPQPSGNSGSAGSAREPVARTEPAQLPTEAPARAADVIEPAFDVVRVEPSGESVIAGRAAPGATVELLSNGVPFARAVADQAGLFAFVPPTLPPGSHEIALQSLGAGGGKTNSEQSVTVVIAPGRDQPPLVAITRPGQPAVILSQPESPGRVAALPAAPGTSDPARSSMAGVPPEPKPPTPGASPPASGPPPPASSGAAPRADVRIAAVEAEGSGRLYISGLAAPGSTIRLYLNDAFVAPGATAPDGRLAFSIERGVRPGDYRVRLDDIDPVTGAVRSRAEVPFNVPSPPLSPPLPPPLPPVAERPSGQTPTASSGITPPVSQGAAQAIRPSVPDKGGAAGQKERDVTVSPTVVAGASPTLPSNLSPPTRATPPVAPSPVMSATAAGTPDPGKPDPARTDKADASRTDPGAVVVPEVSTAIVARGDNLWQISKRIYGRGLRYTVIFGANTPQIRDPNRIYPGQVFVLPNERAEAVVR